MIHLPILQLSCKQQKCVKDPSKNVNSSEDFLMLRLKFMKYLSMDTLDCLLLIVRNFTNLFSCHLMTGKNTLQVYEKAS